MKKKFKERNTGYFQGILQLRSPREEIIEFLKKELQKHKGVFVSKEKKVAGGLDVYLSSNRFAVNAGNKLLKKFGGTLKVNEKLFTRNRQTSRDVYRMAVMFRPSGFAEGDIVSAGKTVMRITGMGKKISGENLATGKKGLINPEEISKLETFRTTISKAYPEVEAIHPETYQSVKVRNPKKVQPGEKVKVVVHDGVWIVE